MGQKYTTQATSGYDSSPPPDDGTQVAANLITWSGVKTKLTNVLKTFAEAINTALVSALDLSARAISVNDTAIASDHWKTLQVTGATTITLSSAASMGAGYEVGVFNAGVGVVTVTPGLASDTINGVSASVTVSIKGTKIFRTNQALTGYNVVGGYDPQTVTATTSVISPIIDTGSAGSGTLKTNNGTTVLTWANDLSVKPAGLLDLTTATSGQIGFPAAQNASAGVNVLDDYEEGTWTPSLGGTTTYTTQSGSYTKIGRSVTILCELVINAIGSGSTTTVSGLPFAPSVNQVAFAVRVVSAGATAIVSSYGTVNTGNIQIFSRIAANAADGANAIFQNGTSVHISGTYFV